MGGGVLRRIAGGGERRPFIDACDRGNGEVGLNGEDATRQSRRVTNLVH